MQLMLLVGNAIDAVDIALDVACYQCCLCYLNLFFFYVTLQFLILSDLPAAHFKKSSVHRV